jgi:hypothetical protein
MNALYKVSAVSLGVLFALFTVSAPAQSPREQLDKLAAQLRTHPGDSALREKVIKLAHTVKPAPAVPEEARRMFVRGNSAFKEAKTPDEFNRVVALYNDAANLAPWWADVYFNLAKAQEQKQSYPEAIAALKFYLLAAPKAPDARDAQDKIYVLEEKAERAGKVTAEKAAAAQQTAQRKQLASTLSSQLSSMFAGKVMRAQYECTLNPNVFTGCTLAEYKINSNWQIFNAVYPRGVLFEVSPDGDKIHFRVGYDNGPKFGGGGYFNPYVGTPTVNDMNSIKWADDQGKPKTIQFWHSKTGQPVYEITDAPVAQEAPGFDPSRRYRYSKHIGE